MSFVFVTATSSCHLTSSRCSADICPAEADAGPVALAVCEKLERHAELEL
jgi:hypothetical protein